jgi:hypothetical protein
VKQSAYRFLIPPYWRWDCTLPKTYYPFGFPPAVLDGLPAVLLTAGASRSDASSSSCSFLADFCFAFIFCCCSSSSAFSVATAGLLCERCAAWASCRHVRTVNTRAAAINTRRDTHLFSGDTRSFGAMRRLGVLSTCAHS